MHKSNLIQSLTPFLPIAFVISVGRFIDLDKTLKNNDNIKEFIPSNEKLISTREKIERAKCLNLL